MTARSVAWDSGEAIPGTYFRHMIKGTDAGGRFSSQSAVLQPGELVLSHSHRDEDEFTFVFRGRVGGRGGENDVVAEEGEFLFKPLACGHRDENLTGMAVSPIAGE